jgi:hypothetical protein
MSQLAGTMADPLLDEESSSGSEPEEVIEASRYVSKPQLSEPSFGGLEAGAGQEIGKEHLASSSESV